MTKMTRNDSLGTMKNAPTSEEHPRYTSESWLKEGTVYRIFGTGRYSLLSTPVPRIDTSTDRRARKTVQRVNGWMVNNLWRGLSENFSANEARQRLLLCLGVPEVEQVNVNDLSHADLDGVNLYLAGEMLG